MELTSITPGPSALRALSHPVRLRLLELLRVDGPSTATALAAQLGLNSGSTSYHLRQLATHGFVTDDETRGNGRERWWRAAHQATRVPTSPAADGATDRESNDAFLQAVAVIRTEELQRAMEERPLLPDDWRGASTFSDWGLVLTPARAKQLVSAVAALIESWDEEEDVEGADHFTVAVTAYPRPGRLVRDPEDGR